MKCLEDELRRVRFVQGFQVDALYLLTGALRTRVLGNIVTDNESRKNACYKGAIIQAQLRPVKGTKDLFSSQDVTLTPRI